MQNKKFPKDFIWGAATSSHQVEGGNDNDWTEWERSGHIHNNDQSGLAADHWNRYEEDFDILEKLHLNTYRFSIEWSRIEPEEGRFDPEAIEHYRQMILSLKQRGITPTPTLHHFTNPKWLPDWTHRSNVAAFARYTKFVVDELGDLCEHWCTINEPNNFVLLGYMSAGIWPPGLNSKLAGYKAINNLARAHNAAYKIIHETYNQKQWTTPRVSITLQLNYFVPATANPLDKLVANVARKVRNFYLLNKVRNKLDYLGLNYYFTFHVEWNNPQSFQDIRYPKLDLPKNDLGWNMQPEGLYHVLCDLKKLNLPILITENGIPDAEDKQRRWFIVSHLEQIHRAMQEGVPVFGYIHWSLLDNFEWADGFSGRFGLVDVDFKTQQRTIRDSALVYAHIARTGELPEVKP